MTFPSSLLIASLCVVLAAGCAPAPRQPLDAIAITASLQASGLPVADVRAFDATTDPNKLLGRPSQYVTKVNWQDSRAASVGSDATIEVFANTADLQARQKNSEAIAKTPMFAQYVTPNETRLALMRLPRDLTPEQADAYKTWFVAL